MGCPTKIMSGLYCLRHASDLFGFDCTRELSTRSAEQIARTAQAYGQQDDITVLAVTFAPAQVIA